VTRQKIGQHRKREALKRLVDIHEVLRAYDGNERYGRYVSIRLNGKSEGCTRNSNSLFLCIKKK
jgi:hypothetical protein